MPTIFDRLTRSRPTEPRIAPPSNAQLLLTWLQKSGRQKITTRDVRIYAPKTLRTREGAINSINVLVRHGWLIPHEPRQRNSPEWRVVRKEAVVYPTL